GELRAHPADGTRDHEPALEASERASELPELLLRGAQVQRTRRDQIVQAGVLRDRQRAGVVLARLCCASQTKRQDRALAEDAAALARRRRLGGLRVQGAEGVDGLFHAAEITRRDAACFPEREARIAEGRARFRAWWNEREPGLRRFCRTGVVPALDAG